MGEVYRARDPLLRSPVALKVLAEHLIADPVARERLVREAQTARRVRHPGIATVYDLVECPVGPVIVMEFVEGRRLDEVLQAERPGERPEGRSGERRVAAWGAALAGALAAIHEQGLVHRDVKPGNVMLLPDGTLKLLDFGVARLADDPRGDVTNNATCDASGADRATSTGLTLPGTLIGTAAYMSPEQAAGRTAIPASDLFALGVILFEALTGEHPFRRDDPAATRAAIINDPPGTPAQRTWLARTRVGTVVLQLLEKDPAQRGATAAAVAAQLRTAAHAPRVRRAWIAAAASAVAVIALAVLVVIPPGGSRLQATVAVVPLTAPGDDPRAAARSAMVADLVAAELGARAGLRVVAPDRITDAIASVGPRLALSGPIEVVRRAARPGRLVIVRIAGEDNAPAAEVKILAGDQSSPGRTFRVEGRAPADLAARVAAQVLPFLAPAASATVPEVPAPRVDTGSEVALVLYAQAQRLARTKDDAEARARLSEALALDPEYVDAWLLTARLAAAGGNDGAAAQATTRARALLQARGIPREAPQALEAAVLEASRAHDVAAEIAALEALTRAVPGRADHLVRLGWAFLDAGRPGDAERVLAQARDADDADLGARFAWASLLAHQRRAEDARAAAEQNENLAGLLGVPAWSAQAAHHRGRIEQQIGQLSAARDHFLRARDRYRAAGLTAWAALALYDAALVAQRTWELDEAAREFEEAVPALRAAGSPYVVEALGSLAGLHYGRGRFAEAERVARAGLAEAAALGLGYWTFTPTRVLANALLASNAVAEARERLDDALRAARAVDDRWSALRLEFSLGLADFVGGDYERARARWEGVLKDTTGDPEIRANAASSLADVLLELGDLEGAAARAEASVTAYGEALDVSEVDRAFAICTRAKVGAVAGRIPDADRRPGDADERIARVAADIARAEQALARREAPPELADICAWAVNLLAANHVRSAPDGVDRLPERTPREVEPGPGIYRRFARAAYAEALLAAGRRAEARAVAAEELRISVSAPLRARVQQVLAATR